MSARRQIATSDPGLVRRIARYGLAEHLGQIGHWSWRVGQRFIECSPGALELFAIPLAGERLSLVRAFRAFHPTDRKPIRAHLDAAMRTNSAFEFEGRLISGDAEPRIIRSRGECEHDGDRAVAVFGVLEDITDWRRTEHALAEAETRAADFAEVSSDWLWETDAQHRFTYMSPQVEAVTGVPVDFHIGKTRQELMNEDTLTLEMEMHLAWLDQHKPFHDFRYWRIGHDGRRQFISTSGKPFFGADGTFLGFRGAGRDMTEEQRTREALVKANRAMMAANKEKSDALASLKEANALLEEQAEEMLRVQEEIQHTALHDPLTGIANRRYLDERLSEWASLCRRERRSLAVLHIDLDRFKQINDTAGHAAGDALLVHVARTLQDTVRHEDFVARVGGDEFVVLCANYSNAKVLSRIAERIVKRLSQPFVYEGRECWFGASIGIAEQTGNDIVPGELLVNADIALYRAKSHGRGRYEYFSSDVQAEIVRERAVADGIRNGLRHGEFLPYYQPQIDARTFEIAGFEALARWHHPRDGVLTPAAFLAIAEDLNVVADIDRRIMECTLTDYDRWRSQGLTIPKLSVNVSARRLLEEDLIAGLREMDLPRGVISFELLESVFLDRIKDQLLWNIDMLREMGVAIELDDFGSGHCSIISLIKLGPDALKIDRELIYAITEDQARHDLVRSIIEIGRSLNVRVVAEGVETMRHAEILSDLGCDVLQGFLFARPLPAAEVPGFIANWARRDRPLGRVAAARSDR